MTRELAHLVVVAAVTAVAAVAFAGVRLPDAAAHGPARLPVPGGTVVDVAVADPADLHVVDLRYGSRRTAVVLSPDRPREVVIVPHLAEDHVLVAQADPPAAVRLLPDPTGRARTLAWAPVMIPPELPPARPADEGAPIAVAAVDGSDVWGVRPNGVPLRAGPRVGSRKIATVYHGDQLEADCWVVGEPIGNGYDGVRDHTYRSAVWFRVRTWDGQMAFIPDTRFSRSGTSGRLGLSRCDEA